MDAIAFLREDHDNVLTMLDQLERGPAAGQVAVTPQDFQAYRDLVTRIVMAESAHEAIEEQYFWPSVIHWLPEGRNLASPALEQEQAAKKLLHRLENLDHTDPEFEDLVCELIAAGRTHIAYEQDEVWPVVRERVSSSELEELGEKMVKARKLAPTRPHPHTPPKPGVLKTAGVAAAATDKLRDAATGRGKDTD